MRTLAAGIGAHVLLPATTLAWGMRVQRADGAIFGFTDHDTAKTVTIDAVALALEPANAISISSIAREIGLAVANLEATVLAFDATMTKVDLLDGVWDGAEFDIFQFNWASPSDGLIEWMSGQFGASTPRLGSFVIELRGITQCFQNDTTPIVQADCSYRFGGPGCLVALGPHTYTATVTVVTSQRQFTIDLANPLDDFTEGELLWLTGLNTGRRRKVMTHTGAGVVTIAEAALRTIQVGDTATIIRGCRKRRVDCISFLNVLRFPGFDQKPSRGELADGDVA